MDPHQHHPVGQADETSPPPSNTAVAPCRHCGGPTACSPPPAWSELSPPPTYRPIRAPAVKLSPTNSQQAIILVPVPQARKTTVVSPPYHFQVPVKRVQSPDDIRRFHASDSGKNFLGFVVALSESIRSRKISDPCHQSPLLSSILSILHSLTNWVDEIPPFSNLLVTVICLIGIGTVV